MSTENAQSAPAAGEGAVSTDTTAGTDTSTQTQGQTAAPHEGASAGAPAAGDVNTPPGQAPVVGADGKPAPAYVPNFKYKAALQEKELDEFWRPLVKDADSEKKVKELFTKVDAFDFMKTKKEEIERNYDSLSNDYMQMGNVVRSVEGALQRGDLSSVFRQLNVSTQQVFQWAQQQIQRMEMDPQQRAQIERMEQAQSQNYTLEQEVSNLRQAYEQQATQARVMQLEHALSKPGVAEFAQNWDSMSGEGSFRTFVIEEAQRVFFETQQLGKAVDLTPEQAIQRVMDRFGKFLPTGGTVAQQPQAVPQGATIPQSQKPVIPNITGKAASPIKKVPKSLDDLKRLAKEAQAL